MERLLQITFDKADYAEGKLLINDKDLLEDLKQRPEKTVKELSENICHLNLENITITESGQIIIENEAFCRFVRQSQAMSPYPPGPYQTPPYITNNYCGNSPMTNRNAYRQVTNYWCDEISEESGTNYYCT